MWRLYFGISLMLMALQFGPLPAEAEARVSGAEDPRFLDATQFWLKGSDDLSALQDLSMLATDGNIAAQILLARIASHSHLIQEVTQALSRSERIALLRQPGGLFGRSWLEVAAEDSDYARALRDSALAESRAPAIGPLFAFGESAVATRALAALFHHGQGEEALEIAASGVELPPEAWILIANMVRGTQIEAAVESGLARALSESGSNPTAISLTWDPISPRALTEDPEQRAVAIENTMFVPAFQPLVAFCQSHCPDEIAECTAAGAAELGSADIMPFASPSQALIPNDVYWQSERIQRDVVALLNLSLRAPSWDYYSMISQCFVNKMDNEAD